MYNSCLLRTGDCDMTKGAIWDGLCGIRHYKPGNLICAIGIETQQTGQYGIGNVVWGMRHGKWVNMGKAMGYCE